LLGRILGKTDLSRSGEAEKYILRGMMTLDERKVKAWSSMGQPFLAELYADTGQGEKSFEALNKAEGMMLEMGIDYWQRRTQEVLERVEG
jgi:hypothetical protein